MVSDFFFFLMQAVSFWDDEKVLDMNSVNSYTTLWIYLVPMNCTLKMVQIGKFMLCVFYTIL